MIVRLKVRDTSAKTPCSLGSGTEIYSLQQDASLHLWHRIIDCEGTTFVTAGRGSRPGIEFTYEISRSSRAAGRHYSGQSIPGYGNELWIITLPDGERKKKSISRSTVDLAYRNAVEEQEREGFVSGPKTRSAGGKEQSVCHVC